MSEPAAVPEWASSPATVSHQPSHLEALVRTARVRQWLKNVLVFAAPGAAGVLLHPHVLVRAVGVFLLFCAASSGTYFVNDAMDVEADRLHPVKRHRPMAASLFPVRQGWTVGLLLLGASIGLSFLLGPKTAVVTSAYVGFTLSYSLWLKREPVVEMGVLAAGFILRAIAGGVAAGVPLSDWFLIVASFGSLFMVGGKRYAEYRQLGQDRIGHRAALAHYSMDYLRHIRSVSSAVTMAGYCLWAFEKAGAQGHTTAGAIWFQLSIAPFVMALLRYALVLEQGGGGAPEDVVIGDRLIQGLGGIWLLCFALGVYGA